VVDAEQTLPPQLRNNFPFKIGEGVIIDSMRRMNFREKFDQLHPPLLWLLCDDGKEAQTADGLMLRLL
jgi:hypothetical protein